LVLLGLRLRGGVGLRRLYILGKGKVLLGLFEQVELEDQLRIEPLQLEDAVLPGLEHLGGRDLDGLVFLPSGAVDRFE
jgi:hypothetical protein